MKYIIIFGLVCYLKFISGQLVTIDSDAYCYQFTWLGRKYDNSSTVNVTCEDITNSPCIEPFVVTTHATIPNTTWMWQNLNRSTVTCPLRSGYICIKYSYSYNDAVLNTTYFCGKMIEDQTKPVESGCYTQTVNGHIIEACACKSHAGNYPCNSSFVINHSITVTIFLILLCDIYNKSITSLF